MFFLGTVRVSSGCSVQCVFFLGAVCVVFLLGVVLFPDKVRVFSGCRASFLWL